MRSCSRAEGSLSSRYRQDSDRGVERPWIVPDIPVVLTVEDSLAGVDPVLERRLGD